MSLPGHPGQALWSFKEGKELHYYKYVTTPWFSGLAVIKAYY
jgi:hypothetical protein